MTVIPARVKCDQCGTVAEYKEMKDWLRIQGRQSRDAIVNLYVGDKGLADLCSWKCLRDYAVVQVLDPESGS